MVQITLNKDATCYSLICTISFSLLCLKVISRWIINIKNHPNSKTHHNLKQILWRNGFLYWTRPAPANFNNSYSNLFLHTDKLFSLSSVSLQFTMVFFKKMDLLRQLLQIFSLGENKLIFWSKARQQKKIRVSWLAKWK